MALTADQQEIVKSLADRMNIPSAWALGVIDKESNGIVAYDVDGKKLPCIFIEGHYFYKYLGDTAKRAEAVAKGLASKARFGKPGGVKVPNRMKDRYAQLQRMIDIDEDAAYKSISIGVGQTMGAEYAAYGYTSPKQMFRDACKGFEVQVWQLLYDIKRIPARMRAIQNRDFKAFAKSYNGPAAPASYWTDLERYVTGYERGAPVTSQAVNRIKKLGYKNVQDFQAARSIEADGIVGPITRAEITKAEAKQAKADFAPTKDAILKGAGGAVIGTAGVIVNDPGSVFEKVQEFTAIVDVFSPVLYMVKSYGPAFMVGAGGVIVWYFLYRAIKEYAIKKDFAAEREAEYGTE